MRENGHAEFKREYTDDIRKDAVAFANTGGGVIRVGRDDAGNVRPVSDMAGTLTRITDGIRDGVLPDVTGFVRCEMNESGIVVEVSEGTDKPYFLSEKGLKPSGVYVRRGASSVPAGFERIREMIELTNGDGFETARSLAQDLSFKEASDEFERRGVEFGENQMRALGMIGQDGLYTNLGLLLSDQCAHAIKIALFDGTKKGEFKTREEIGGSLLEQTRSAFECLSFTNKLPSVVSGLERMERYDYPEKAVREALLNAIVHRDYGFSGSVIVNVYDDRMEFVSPGGIASGLRVEDLLLGISQSRNERLAKTFLRLGLVEACGVGLRNIMECYEDHKVKPMITATGGAFSLTLPNMNHARPLLDPGPPNPRHKAMLDYLRTNGVVTNEDARDILGVKQTRAYAIIREMVGAGLIVKRGSGRKDKEYVLVE
jgi:ATP-dependent DNA helicase RecG